MAGLDKNTSNFQRNNAGRARSQKGEMGNRISPYRNIISSGYSQGHTVPGALAGQVKSGA